MFKPKFGLYDFLNLARSQPGTTTILRFSPLIHLGTCKLLNALRIFICSGKEFSRLIWELGNAFLKFPEVFLLGDVLAAFKVQTGVWNDLAKLVALVSKLNFNLKLPALRAQQICMRRKGLTVEQTRNECDYWKTPNHACDRLANRFWDYENCDQYSIDRRSLEKLRILGSNVL